MVLTLVCMVALPLPAAKAGKTVSAIPKNTMSVVSRMADLSAIPSFFEIKEAGGVCTLSEKNRIVGF
jgi:hypothetical protein